jgi:ATP-dependent helicase/nuclease subunit B
MIARVKRIMKRTVWALQEQIKKGAFQPGGWEISFSMEDQLDAVQFDLSREESLRLTGRIDRMDVCEDEERVYVKIIDYKSGNTSLDLIELYHGLQLQLVVYMNAALELEQKKHSDKEVAPAGVFYYNIKDPVISGQGGEQESDLQEAILKDLRMNGLVSSDERVLPKLDSTFLESGKKQSSVVPVGRNKDGSLSRNSTAIEEERFALLSQYVNGKIQEIGSRILQGDVQAKPYQYGQKTGCTYCQYRSICGFDEHIKGYEYQKLKQYGNEEVWQAMREDVGTRRGIDGDEMDQ